MQSGNRKVRKTFIKYMKQTLISPSQLFDSRILRYQVKTNKLGKVRYVNLDNAATTPPFKSVEEGVLKYLSSYGSVHRGAGTKSKISTDIYEDTRDVIKRFVNAPDDNYVIFTGNTTGGMNTAAYFFSFLSGNVAVSEIEHSSSWLPWVKTEGYKLLGSEQIKLSQLNSINQRIQDLGRQHVIQYHVNENFEFDLNDIEKTLKENRIKAFVLTASSNVTGYCPDIKAIGRLVHKYKAWFVVDACQFIQHHKIDMQDQGIDFLIASGHKFYAPYGGGFLIGPKTFLDEFLPYQIGGGNLPYITASGEFLRYKNQLAHDPGTPNALGSVAMALALKQITEIGINNIEVYEHTLTQEAYKSLQSNPFVDLYVSPKHLSTVIPFNIKGKDPKDVASQLNDEYGIGVRAGSFCAYQTVRSLLHIQDDKKITKLVKAGDTSLIPGFIRASFGICNRPADVKRFIQAIENITQ